MQWKNLISVNRNSTNYEIDEVLCDGRKIASQAVEYLIRLGHRKIAYVGECHSESRFKGFQETLIKYNIETDIDYIIQTGLSENDGYSASYNKHHLIHGEKIGVKKFAYMIFCTERFP